jgi:hypothetical protein
MANSRFQGNMQVMYNTVSATPRLAGNVVIHILQCLLDTLALFLGQRISFAIISSLIQRWSGVFEVSFHLLLSLGTIRVV